jgi:hypothetical protein
MAAEGRLQRFDSGLANDRNRRNLAVDGGVGEGPLATLLSHSDREQRSPLGGLRSAAALEVTAAGGDADTGGARDNAASSNFRAPDN